MPIGKLVKKIGDRGFGYVRCEETGAEYFIHANTLPRHVFDQLPEGSELKFDIWEDPNGRGLRVKRAVVLGASPPKVQSRPAQTITSSTDQNFSRHRGKIVRLLEQGFGFVRTDDETEYFFYCKQVKNKQFDELNEGLTLEFELVNDPSGRGIRAVNVLVITP